MMHAIVISISFDSGLAVHRGNGNPDVSNRLAAATQVLALATIA